MSGQSRRARGRESEEAVAEFLRRNGFPYAERRPASLPGSDIVGLAGIDVEVKARRGLDLNALLRQQAARLADGVVPVGVIRPDGAGPATVHRWPAVLPLGMVVSLLLDAGFGGNA